MVGGPLSFISSPAEFDPTILPATSEENIETQLGPFLRDMIAGKCSQIAVTQSLFRLSTAVSVKARLINAEQHARHGVSENVKRSSLSSGDLK